jgi:Holliday junction resolvasome RuvABC endonuclease subunit
MTATKTNPSKTRFIRVESRGVIHYVNSEVFNVNSIRRGDLSGGVQYEGAIAPRKRSAARVIGIDPSERATGFATLNIEDWRGKLQLDHYAVVSAVEMGFTEDIEKIRYIGMAYQTALRLMDPTMMAIELPFVPGGQGKKGQFFRNKSTIVQARLFQHLIDTSPGHYYQAYSEINNSSAKSAVLQRGDSRKKESVVKRVIERYDLEFDEEADPKWIQAVCDAIAIATAFVNRSNSSATTP